MSKTTFKVILKDYIVNDKVIKRKLHDKLNKLTTDLNWFDRIEFIISKYIDKPSNEFDIQFLYMLTYSLRGKYHQEVTELYEYYFKSIFDHCIVPGSIVYILIPDMNNIHKYGLYISNLIERSIEIWKNIMQQMSIEYKFITTLETDIKPNSFIINLRSLFNNSDSHCDSQNDTKIIKSKNCVEVLPIEYSTAKNKSEAIVNNIILNLFNCCYGDTITDPNEIYVPIQFNIIY